MLPSHTTHSLAIISSTSCVSLAFEGLGACLFPGLAHPPLSQVKAPSLTPYPNCLDPLIPIANLSRYGPGLPSSTLTLLSSAPSAA